MYSHNNSIIALEMADHETDTNPIIQSPFANEHEIRDHFDTCMKMFAENRISIKNAWNLKIIDYMSIILTSEDQSNESLQMAATSIQAATKIYTIRVDDVHSNMLKLASNLVRTNAQEDEKQLDEGDSQRQRTHKRTKRGGKKATVSNDSSIFVGEVPKLPSTFFSNVQDVDIVATNLLSSKVPMHYTGYKFALLSQEPAWTSAREKSIIHAKQYPIKIEPIDKVQLCAQFQDFEIDVWNEDDEIVLDENPHVPSIIYNDEGVLVPQLDDSIVEIFPPDDQATEKRRVRVQNDFCSSSSKYVFGNKEVARLWAGPNHLKFKDIRKTSDHNKYKKPKSEKRTAQPINFSADDFPALNKLKLCKRKLKTSEEDYNKCTLPQKFIVENSTNTGLISKPLFVCKPNPDFLKEPHTDVSVQSVENKNVTHEGSFHDADVSVHEEVVYSNAAATCEENLIDFPEMVVKFERYQDHQDFKGYAAKEKRINMKCLKRSIWKSLIVQNDAEEMVQKRKFSEVYSELPGKLNKRYKKELSCPQAFVALLHVANEKNLCLTKIDNENDFHIEKRDSFE